MTRQQTIRRLSEAQNHHCAYCAVVMLTRDEIRKIIVSRESAPPGAKSRSHWKASVWARLVTFDHFDAECNGGAGGYENGIAACTWCNTYRGNQPAQIAFERIQRLVRRGSHPHIAFAQRGVFPAATMNGLRTISPARGPQTDLMAESPPAAIWPGTGG